MYACTFVGMLVGKGRGWRQYLPQSPLPLCTCVLGGQIRTLVLLCHSLSYPLKQELSLNPESAISARLANSELPVAIPLPQCMPCGSAQPCPGIFTGRLTEIGTLVLRFAHQVLFPQSHLPGQSSLQSRVFLFLLLSFVLIILGV